MKSIGLPEGFLPGINDQLHAGDLIVLFQDDSADLHTVWRHFSRLKVAMGDQIINDALYLDYDVLAGSCRVGGQTGKERLALLKERLLREEKAAVVFYPLSLSAGPHHWIKEMSDLSFSIIIEEPGLVTIRPIHSSRIDESFDRDQTITFPTTQWLSRQPKDIPMADKELPTPVESMIMSRAKGTEDKDRYFRTDWPESRNGSFSTDAWTTNKDYARRFDFSKQDELKNVVNRLKTTMPEADLAIIDIIYLPRS